MSKDLIDRLRAIAGFDTATNEMTCSQHVCWSAADTIERLERELASMTADRDDCLALAKLNFAKECDYQKQNVLLREFVKLLRDYIPASAVGNMTVQEALAATADLEGLVLCEGEPVAWLCAEDGLWREKSEITDTPLYRALEQK